MKEIFTFITLFLGVNSFAQISVKTEYISNSKFYDAVSDSNIGDGSAMIYSVGALVPLSMKAPEEDDPYQRPTLWGVGLNGSFFKADNHNLPARKDFPSEIMNLGVTALHIRPLKTRWSMLMALGVGSYTPENRLSSIHIGENVIANGAFVFVYHWKPNIWEWQPTFEIGAGVALNNTFGYPMVFPALYFKFQGGIGDKFSVEIGTLDGAKLAFGYNFSEHFNLKLMGSIGGYSAYVRHNGRKEIFSQMNFITGLQPEITIGKHVSIPIIVGTTFMRLGTYKERKLSAMFVEEIEARDELGNPITSRFQPAFYLSAGITIK